MREQLAVSVILEREGRFLLVERAHEPGKGLFAFPGGRVGQGESLHDAAARELLEETGMTASGFIPAGEFHLATRHGAFHLHVFATTRFSGEPVAGDDAASAGWYTAAEMKVMPMPQSMHDMLARLERTA